MVEVSFFDQAKDKITSLLPNTFEDSVESCTKGRPGTPTDSQVEYFANCLAQDPDSVGELVRAVRNRLAVEHPIVQHATILLLDGLIKRCGMDFHVEIALNRPLLKELVDIATDPLLTSQQGQLTKRTASTLILNLSVWFVGYPHPQCIALTELADDVRLVEGSNAFLNIAPDTSVRLHVQAISRPNARGMGGPHGRQPTSAGAASALSRRPHQENKNVVDAIAVKFPQEKELSAMLDTCVAFSEYLNNAVGEENRANLTADEVVSGFSFEVQRNLVFLSMLQNSDLNLPNKDVISCVCDSQRAVLARVKEITARSTPTHHAPGECESAGREGGFATVHPTQGSELASDASVRVENSEVPPPRPTPAESTVPTASPEPDAREAEPEPHVVETNAVVEPLSVESETAAPIEGDRSAEQQEAEGGSPKDNHGTALPSIEAIFGETES